MVFTESELYISQPLSVTDEAPLSCPYLER